MSYAKFRGNTLDLKQILQKTQPITTRQINVVTRIKYGARDISDARRVLDLLLKERIEDNSSPLTSIEEVPTQVDEP